jgi:hypothetical protein
MLQLKKKMVYTISDGYLGRWDDDNRWVPNQVVVGSSVDGQVIAKLLGLDDQPGDTLCQFGKPVATLERDAAGKITQIHLVAQK